MQRGLQGNVGTLDTKKETFGIELGNIYRADSRLKTYPTHNHPKYPKQPRSGCILCVL